jgi:hypothetical protein
MNSRNAVTLMTGVCALITYTFGGEKLTID